MELNENNPLILNHIKYIFARMVNTKQKPRTNVPCMEELEYIELLRPIPITVFLFDGRKLPLTVESYTSIRDLKIKVMDSLELNRQASIYYSLYEICTKANGQG